MGAGGWEGADRKGELAMSAVWRSRKGFIQGWRRASAIPFSTKKPSWAILTEGARRSLQGSLAKALCARQYPATSPGTPTASHPPKSSNDTGKHVVERTVSSGFGRGGR